MFVYYFFSSSVIFFSGVCLFFVRSPQRREAQIIFCLCVCERECICVCWWWSCCIKLISRRSEKIELTKHENLLSVWYRRVSDGGIGGVDVLLLRVSLEYTRDVDDSNRNGHWWWWWGELRSVLFPFFFCSSSMFTSSVIVVYLSDEILFPCACARLMHELRWLCVCVCVSFGWDCFCFRSIYSFRSVFFPSFAFHFNVISLSRWKIFMANGSVFYTQPVVIAKSCSK